jgi:hypothetical protein
MNTIFYWIIGIVVAFLISLFFETVREFILESLNTFWESLLDGWSYFISFEWIGDILSFLGGMFENLDEFSSWGLAFGALSCGIIWMLSDYLIKPFMKYADPVSSIIWTVLTYVVCGVVGYLMGKKMFDD